MTVFSIPRASNYFFNLAFHILMFPAPVYDLFITSLSTSSGVTAESLFNNFNMWKSIRVEVYCLLFLLILTNGFGRLGFDSHANDLKLWEYLRAQIGTNFFPGRMYLLPLRSWECLQYWITLAPGRSVNPSCSCFKALHWVAYLFPLICVYHPSFWPNIFSFFFFKH